MSGGSGSVRKTETTENTNVGVVWMAQKQRKIGGDIGIGFGRTDIEKICSGVESLSPVLGWHGRLKKKGTDNIIDSTKRTFSFAILRRSVGTRKTEKNAMVKKEGAIFNIIEFTTIITLDEANREKEVYRDVSLKIEKEGVNVGFVAERKSSDNVCKII